MYGSLQGNGHKTASEHYPFQGLDIATEPYCSDYLGRHRVALIERSRSLVVKFAGQRTPLGTPVAMVVRLGGELLIAPCGNCGAPVDRCPCDFRAAAA